MATYVYDDFRVTFSPRADGSYDVRAVDEAGGETTGTFRRPLTDDELARAVRGAVEHARGAGTTRDIGASGPPAFDAEQVGSALAAALLDGTIGAAYDRARAAAATAGRGLRLSLSLADAPALLSVPWEFVYKRPRFLASQRQTPLVRVLDTGALTKAAVIDSTVRVLGVIASPRDLAPLAVDKERQGIELALGKVRQLGRIELDWLAPATPRGLREALRDGSYHVLHFVGHSDFTPDGNGVVYLEDDDGRASAVDDTLLANLLSDQDHLRLVVLNSCEGARTTLTDPYAGIATTLISLGVPAVVAMQFEISDRAAIVFAEELYTNLIGRQDPIDAAVAEARKAVYTQVDPIEWATPVLFVRDPDVELFRFGVPAAPLPPPPPAGVPTVEPAARHEPPPRRRRGLVAALAAGAVAVVAGAAFVLTRPGGDGASGATTTPSVAEPTGPAPRPRTGFHAVQVLEPDGDVHLLNHDPQTGFVDAATDRSGSKDTEPDWHRETNWLAFQRAEPSPSCTGICYVVPNDRSGDNGKQVAQLVPFVEGSRQHAPAWSAGSTLYYARSAGCPPGPGCAEEVRRARFTAVDDGTGFGDALSVADDVIVATGLEDVRDLDADPQDRDAFAVATAGGVVTTSSGGRQQLATSVDASSLTYTPDGNRLVALGTGGSTLEAWNRDGTPLGTLDVATLATEFAAAGGVLPGLAPERAVASSISPDAEGGRLLVLLDDPAGDAPPVLAKVDISEQGTGEIVSAAGFPVDVLERGAVQAVAR